jgi:putative acetyltransferase
LPCVATLHRSSILGLCAQHYSVVQLSGWTDALRPEAYAVLLASHEFLVAEKDGVLLGFGILDLSDSLINAIYVSPKVVRRGVGRRLLEAMETIARVEGVLRLQLSSTLNAVPFYEIFGYLHQEAGTNRLPTGVELPCIRMTKDFVDETQVAGQRSDCSRGRT